MMIEPNTELTPVMRQQVNAIIDRRIAETPVTREDFSELKAVVAELAQAQGRTEARVEELTHAQQRTEARVEELTHAQQRTEARVEELTHAQQRTEARVEELTHAQQRTEARVEELAHAQQELAQAQQRTEARVEELAHAQQELAQAQQRTEVRVEELAHQMTQGFKSLSDQIAALGSRWGIYNEGTFRATIRGLLAKMDGIAVREGHYGGRQVDVVIRNGEHVLLEITSRMHSKDIDRLYQSADDYHACEGVEPVLMVATSYISPSLMQRIMGLERKIDIFSYDGEE